MSTYKYRYWCGLLISSNTYTYVRTIKVDTESYIEIIPGKKELVIYFKEGSTSSTIGLDLFEKVKDNVELTETEFELKRSAYISGCEVYLSYNADIDRLTQYLLADDLGTTGTALVDKTFGIILTKSFIDLNDSQSYIDLLNADELVYAKVIDDVSFANYAFVDFNGKKIRSTDTYIYGITKAFAVNSVTNLAQFIKELESNYPDISIFVDSQDRDEKKSEWIQVRASLDEVSNGYHTIVHESPTRGRWSQSNARIALEYTTNDIMLSLTRRDQYLHGKFLNDIKVIKFMVGDTEFGCSVFWERNDITTEKPAEDTSHDDANYRLFSFTINCILYFKIAEFVDRVMPTIATVIVQFIETKNKFLLDEIKLRPKI